MAGIPKAYLPFNDVELEMVMTINLESTNFCAILESERKAASGLRKRARTRAMIEVIGAQLLQDVGYRGFTVEAICERADISIGTLYIHFEGKDALARHVLTRFAEHYEAFMMTPADPGESPFHAAYNKFSGIIALHRDSAGLIRAMIEMAGSDDEIERRLSLARLRIRQHLGKICASTSDSNLPPRLRNFLAFTISALINELLIPLYVDGDEDLARALGKPGELAELFAVLWARLIYFQNPPERILSIAKPLLDLKLDWNEAGIPETDLTPLRARRAK